MRFKERKDLADRCKEWMKEQIENNITMPLDTVHAVLAYLDVNGYLNEVVRCKDCFKKESCRTFNVWAVPPSDDWFCADGERRKDAN